MTVAKLLPTRLPSLAPAVGVTYLLQRRSFVLFAIDAGYFLTGMAAMGATFLLFI